MPKVRRMTELRFGIMNPHRRGRSMGSRQVDTSKVSAVEMEGLHRLCVPTYRFSGRVAVEAQNAVHLLSWER